VALADAMEQGQLFCNMLKANFDTTYFPPLAPTRSLAYFQNVNPELQQQPLPNEYLDYLRLKRPHPRTTQSSRRNRIVMKILTSGLYLAQTRTGAYVHLLLLGQ
jgi:hypothetical protein